MWNMQEFGIQIDLMMTWQSRTTTSERKELCTWNRVCVVKWSWRIKPYWWTVRRPKSMTTWKTKIQRNINTKHMTPIDDVSNLENTWLCALCCSLRSPLFSVDTLISCTHLTMAQDVRVFVSSHPCMKWAFLLTSLISSSPSPSFSYSSSTSSSSCYPSTSLEVK